MAEKMEPLEGEKSRYRSFLTKIFPLKVERYIFTLKVWVVPTDEESVIARETWQLFAS